MTEDKLKELLRTYMYDEDVVTVMAAVRAYSSALLQQTPCTALRELLAKMYEEENEVLSNAVCNNLYEREKHANRKYCIAIVMMMLDVRQPVE